VSDASAPLQRDRDLGRLLDDTVALFRRHAGVALLLAAAVVLPVELLISGVGLGQLTSGYSSKVTTGELVFGSLVPLLITTPLVTGMLVRVVLDHAAGERTPAARAAEAGLAVFGPLLGAVLLATAGIMLGFLALVIPGIFLAVRWVVVAPGVVVEGVRGVGALRRSSALVAGSGWWVLGVMIVLAILTGIAGAVITLPADALGRSADSQAVVLIGGIVAQILTLPFTAFATTLLFFTLRARREGAQAGGREGAAFPGDGFAQPDAPPWSAATPGTNGPAADRPLWGRRDEDEDEPIADAPRWRTPTPPEERGGDEEPPPGGWLPPVPPR
jgi:hypothetical protein